jgi:cystathionine beta-lyase/cystathionine gamma-synthase
MQKETVVRQALREPTVAVFVETISNPLLRVPDLPRLAEWAHAAGARLIVDNTFATPVLMQPLEHGADLVIESLTKQINGHSDVTLGVICGRDETLGRLAWDRSVIWGTASASGFDCWLAQRGMKTLRLRVRAAAANAARVADWLAEQSAVRRVIYPGRPDHPDHERAMRLLPQGQGAIVSFELAGGREAVNAFLRAAPGVPFAPSLGGAGTTCSHPASTSHRHDAAAERDRLGITDGLVRLSVGVEEVEEILAELQRGLGACRDAGERGAVTRHEVLL